MTRIILTVGCVGKTYADKHYKNVYDFDKHTLKYKYDRQGYEQLSDEQFKGLPNRKENENWFEKYMEDWCNLIDSNKYEIVTGWLNDDSIEYLVAKGYQIEVIVVDSRENEEIYYERSKQRGNNEQHWVNLKDYYQKTLNKYYTDKRFKVWVLTTPIYLSDFLVFTGSKLIADDNQPRSTINYLTKVDEMLGELFNSCRDTLRALYVNLVMYDVERGFKTIPKSFGYITNRQIHDAWVLSANLSSISEHNSCVPYNDLTTEIQNLDTPYMQELNLIAQNLGELLRGICIPAAGPDMYCSPDNWYFKNANYPEYVHITTHEFSETYRNTFAYYDNEEFFKIALSKAKAYDWTELKFEQSASPENTIVDWISNNLTNITRLGWDVNIRVEKRLNGRKFATLIKKEIQK